MTTRLTVAATALGLVLLHAAATNAAILTVGNCAGASYQTIRAALTAAGTGDEIDLCAGTYNEQVVITKKLRLVGRAGVLIRPTTLPEARASVVGGRPVTGGIIVDVPSVFISDIQLDMSASGITNCRRLYFNSAKMA